MREIGAPIIIDDKRPPEEPFALMVPAEQLANQAQQAYDQGKRDVAIIRDELRKLDDLVLAIQLCLLRIGDLASAVGASEKLKVFLITIHAHALLVTGLHSVKNLIEAQAEQGIVFVPPDSEAYAEFATMTERYASMVDDIINGRDDGRQLISHIERFGEPSTKHLIANLRHQINVGGATEQPELQALYRLAYPLYAKYRGDSKRFSKIRADVETLLLKPSSAYTEDERAVNTYWQGKSSEQRRGNLRYVFAPLEQEALANGL